MFGQKPNETLDVWLHWLAEEKATPVLLKEWKSIHHLMTMPMYLVTLATNSLADDMNMEDE